MKPKEQRMKEINTLLSHIANFEAHKPVHVEYAAVSYTHLDVYKRQGEKPAVTGGFPATGSATGVQQGRQPAAFFRREAPSFP